MPISARASAIGLPVLRISNWASRSRSASSRSANRRSSRERSAGATARQPSKAAAARATAASASSAVAASSRSITASVAGSRTSSTVTRSQPLEAPEPLPVGHGGVEGVQLDGGHVGVVVDHVGPERLAGDLAVGEQVAGLAQGPGDARLVGVVGVAGELVLEGQALVDPVEAG